MTLGAGVSRRGAGRIGGSVILSLLAFASVWSASAGGAASPPSPARTIKSADGGLVVSIPRGAMKRPVAIRVRVLKRSQYPPELKAATFRPGSKLYAVEPDGLTFEKPVTVTRRIDAKLAGFDSQDGLPVVLLTSRDKRGKWSWLTKGSVRRNGNTLVVRGTTKHFSTFLAVDTELRLRLEPGSLMVQIGQTVPIKGVVTYPKQGGNALVSQDQTDPDWIGPDFASVYSAGYDANDTWNADVRCNQAGDDQVELDLYLKRITFEAALLTFGKGTASAVLADFAPLECVAAPQPPAAPRLASACVVTAHQAFESFKSFLRMLFGFDPSSLPPSPRVEVTASDVNNGQPVSAAIDTATGRAEVRGGINSFGDKQLQKVTVNGVDVTGQAVAKLGTSALTVTAAEGTIAGSCPA